MIPTANYYAQENTAAHHTQESTEEGVFSKALLRQYKLPAVEDLHYRYDKYSREQVTELKARLALLAESKFEKEWEGGYTQGSEPQLGLAIFRLDMKVGFVDIYIYDCYSELRYFTYGKVIDNPDSIEIIPEFKPNAEAVVTQKYIKVRWGSRLYLVDEEYLLPFSEKAVGIFVADEADETSYNKWANFLVKGDTEALVAGYPQFPANYKSFERLPIEARVISVGKRVIATDKTDDGTVYNSSADYPVTINAGAKQKVKEGMTFLVPNTQDIITISRVFQNKATGIVSRDLKDDDITDQCFDDRREDIPCRVVRSGMKIQTRVDAFYKYPA
jgi:hypothetical protein